jgi:O-methyltransferase
MKKLLSLFSRTREPVALPKRTPPASQQPPNFVSPLSWGMSDFKRFSELMNELLTLLPAGIYAGDNLVTWGRNNSALEDQPFRQAWEANLKNDADHTIMWRRYVLACAGYHCLQLDGDFVECGVYQGTGIKTVVDYLGGTAFPKNFFGYDTFDYNPVEGHAFIGQEPGFYEKVLERFNGYPQVKLIKGLIPESFTQACPPAIAYLHIDLNSAEAEIAALEVLFHRLVPGGILILDDYEWAGVYRIQKVAEDRWFDDRRYRVMPLPTGQGLVFKR